MTTHLPTHAAMLATTCLALLLASAPALAGKDLADWADDPAKLEKKVFQEGFVPGVRQLKLHEGPGRPEKVGLLSFMVWDVGELEFSALALRYGGTYKQTSGLSEEGGNHFATQFESQSIDDLKEAFAAHDMQLLTPDEFADTDAKRAAYVGFDMPLGGLSKATMAIVDAVHKNPEVSASARGYKAIPAHLFFGDPKLREAMEDLRTELQLDALAVVCTTTHSSKKEVGVAKIELVMWGPNPQEKPKQKIAQAMWAPLTTYAFGHFGPKSGFKGSTVAELKKGEISEESFDGYGEVVGGLANATLTAFDEEYVKGQ